MGLSQNGTRRFFVWAPFKPIKQRGAVKDKHTVASKFRAQLATPWNSYHQAHEAQIIHGCVPFIGFTAMQLPPFQEQAYAHQARPAGTKVMTTVSPTQTPVVPWSTSNKNKNGRHVPSVPSFICALRKVKAHTGPIEGMDASTHGRCISHCRHQRDAQAKALYPMGRICNRIGEVAIIYPGFSTPQTKNNLVDSSSKLRPKPNPKPQAKSVVQCPKPNPEGLARAFHLALAKLRAAKLPSPAPQSKKGPPRGPGLERIGGDWVQRWMGAIHFAPLENHGEIIACWLSGPSERDAERAGTNELSEGRIVTEILQGRFCRSFRPCLLLHSSAKANTLV